jgi:hypothetical protein
MLSPYRVLDLPKFAMLFPLELDNRMPLAPFSSAKPEPTVLPLPPFNLYAVRTVRKRAF